MNTKKNLRRNNILELVFGLLIIIFLNIIGSYIFTRFDLTTEKRYTLSKATKNLLKDLDHTVYFKVYLDGDFPSGFKRMQKATKEMLDEFRAYNNKIQYEFINPSAFEKEEERNAFYQELVRYGLKPTDIHVNKTGESSSQIIFPGALVAGKSQEYPMQLLLSQMGVSPENILNNSIKNLEYNIATTIKKFSFKLPPKVGFITGHQELDALQTADAMTALSDYYKIERINIDGKINALTGRDLTDSVNPRIRNKFDAIIIAKPDSLFSEQDKFIIDQYLMRGGKILWLVDPVLAEMDSLSKQGTTMGIARKLNLEDMFFNFGVRLSTNLIMDLQSLQIPIITGSVGGQPQQQFFNWHYFPVLSPTLRHPIVANLNAIKSEFISSIDTIGNSGIKKTILLESSKYTRTVNTPVLIDLESLRKPAEPEMFNRTPQAVAVLLEGEFKSLFSNRLTSELYDNKLIDFKERSSQTKMIIVSDGDIIKNQIDYRNGRALPLGYDRFTNQSFGNRDFIVNAVNYLLDETGLMEVRLRDIQIRMLDKTRISEQRLMWQILNSTLPIILLIAFGIIQTRMRKAKYTKNK
ncbi:MAG: gliding motility-associated ABC transporter substrate-binding protein GldG [Bacteroidales bacterium]|nr:gliding motility-associated ABC transporter substrate-binding protein GldG [Bacteroidales bacterium]